MEQKLKKYKHQKKRENILNRCNQFFLEIINKFKFENKNIEDSSEFNEVLKCETLPASASFVQDDEDSTLSLAPSEASISFSISTIPFLTILNYFLYLLLWILIYLIAVQLEFGFVYLILSSLFFIYFNTRTGPKKKGEISAYSVFNPDCRSIDGTLKAEQLEREFNLIQHK